MLGAVQRFALSAGVSANLSDAYRGAACGLQWANFQFPLLGAGDRPACKYYTYNAVPDDAVALSPPPLAIASGRRALNHLLPLADSEPARWPSRHLLALSDDDVSQVTQQAYERLLLILLVFVAAGCGHWVVLKLWASCVCSATRPLPSLLVFPHLELLLVLATTVAAAQSAGSLMATTKALPVVIGALVLVYLVLVVAALAYVARMIGRSRAALLDVRMDEVEAHVKRRMLLSLGARLDAAEASQRSRPAAAARPLDLVGRSSSKVRPEPHGADDGAAAAAAVLPLGRGVSFSPAAKHGAAADAAVGAVAGREVSVVHGRPVFSDLEDEKQQLRCRVAARLREKQAEKELLLEPVRTHMYLKSGMGIYELMHLITTAADAASKGLGPAPAAQPPEGAAARTAAEAARGMQRDSRASDGSPTAARSFFLGLGSPPLSPPSKLSPPPFPSSPLPPHPAPFPASPHSAMFGPGTPGQAEARQQSGMFGPLAPAGLDSRPASGMFGPQPPSGASGRPQSSMFGPMSPTAASAASSPKAGALSRFHQGAPAAPAAADRSPSPSAVRASPSTSSPQLDRGSPRASGGSVNRAANLVMRHDREFSGGGSMPTSPARGAVAPSRFGKSTLGVGGSKSSTFLQKSMSRVSRAVAEGAEAADEWTTEVQPFDAAVSVAADTLWPLKLSGAVQGGGPVAEAEDEAAAEAAEALAALADEPVSALVEGGGEAAAAAPPPLGAAEVLEMNEAEAWAILEQALMRQASFLEQAVNDRMDEVLRVERPEEGAAAAAAAAGEVVTEAPPAQGVVRDEAATADGTAAAPPPPPPRSGSLVAFAAAPEAEPGDLHSRAGAAAAPPVTGAREPSALFPAFREPSSMFAPARAALVSEGPDVFPGLGRQLSRAPSAAQRPAPAAPFDAARVEAAAAAQGLSINPPLLALRGVGTAEKLADMSKADRHRLLVQLQLEERLGLLFSDYRRNSSAVMYFSLALVLRDVVAGLLVGIQEGAAVRVGSAASQALNCTLFGTYASFALLLLLLRPPALVWMFLLAYTASVLEAVAAGCIALLSFNTSWLGAQNALFFLQIALLALMTCVTWVCLGTLLVKLVLRWHLDRQMVRAEDEEGASILRKESMLRHSFRESLRASRTRDAATEHEQEQQRAEQLSHDRAEACERGLQDAAELGRQQALELRRKLAAGEQLGEEDMRAAAPSSGAAAAALGQSILGRQVSLPGAVGAEGMAPWNPVEEARLRAGEDEVQPMDAAPAPALSHRRSSASESDVRQLGVSPPSQSQAELQHLNTSTPKQQYQRSRFMPPTPTSPAAPAAPATPTTPSNVLVEQDAGAEDDDA